VTESNASMSPSSSGTPAEGSAFNGLENSKLMKRRQLITAAGSPPTSPASAGASLGPASPAATGSSASSSLPSGGAVTEAVAFSGLENSKLMKRRQLAVSASSAPKQLETQEQAEKAGKPAGKVTEPKPNMQIVATPGSAGSAPLNGLENSKLMRRRQSGKSPTLSESAPVSLDTADESGKLSVRVEAEPPPSSSSMSAPATAATAAAAVMAVTGAAKQLAATPPAITTFKGLENSKLMKRRLSPTGTATMAPLLVERTAGSLAGEGAAVVEVIQPSASVSAEPPKIGSLENSKIFGRRAIVEVCSGSAKPPEGTVRAILTRDLDVLQ